MVDIDPQPSEKHLELLHVLGLPSGMLRSSPVSEKSGSSRAVIQAPVRACTLFLAIFVLVPGGAIVDFTENSGHLPFWLTERDLLEKFRATPRTISNPGWILEKCGGHIPWSQGESAQQQAFKGYQPKKTVQNRHFVSWDQLIYHGKLS